MTLPLDLHWPPPLRCVVYWAHCDSRCFPWLALNCGTPYRGLQSSHPMHTFMQIKRIMSDQIRQHTIQSNGSRTIHIRSRIRQRKDNQYIYTNSLFVSSGALSMSSCKRREQGLKQGLILITNLIQNRGSVLRSVVTAGLQHIHMLITLFGFLCCCWTNDCSHFFRSTFTSLYRSMPAVPCSVLKPCSVLNPALCSTLTPAVATRTV